MPTISFAIPEDSDFAPVVIAYSGRRSVMLRWNMRTDEFEVGQWVKGRAYVLDVSPDGEHVGCSVEVFSRKEISYLTISRVPFFTALAFFAPIFHLGPYDITWKDDKHCVWYGSQRNHTNYPKEDRISGGCPFKIERADESIHRMPGNAVSFLPDKLLPRKAAATAARIYGKMATNVRNPLEASEMFSRIQDVLRTRRVEFCRWDNNGRMIVGVGAKLFRLDNPESEPELLFDGSGLEFKEVPPTDWAKDWNKKRK